MKFFDLIGLILENLGRRKGRVALTAIGVVIGTASVVILVSLAIGLQQSATSQLGGIGDLTQIQVMPSYGEMTTGAAIAQKVSINGGGGGPSVMKAITPATLTELTKIPGVSLVIPRDYLQAGGMFEYARLVGYGSVIGVGTNDLSVFDYQLQSGSLKMVKGTGVIGAAMIKNLMDPRQRPGQAAPTPPDLQDKTIKLVVSKATADGKQVDKTVSIRIVGVIAETRSEADYSLYMPIDDVTALNEWAQGKRINRNKDGYQMAVIKVSDIKNVLDIADQINKMGFQASTPQSTVQGINNFFTILKIVFGGVGAVALLVAAIGIANTMAMAILERTREIGLMKAIGATNNNVLSIFLGEAAGIGLLGGIGGTVLGWGGGKIIGILAIKYLAAQVSGGGPPPSLSIDTPLWLPVFALVFATLIGLLSGLYPALRATTLMPVTALKFE